MYAWDEAKGVIGMTVTQADKLIAVLSGIDTTLLSIGILLAGNILVRLLK
jgi:hypothetical protein